MTSSRRSPGCAFRWTGGRWFNPWIAALVTLAGCGAAEMDRPAPADTTEAAETTPAAETTQAGETVPAEAAETAGVEAVGVELTISGVGPLVDTRPPFPLVETFLAVDPTDASNLLASAMSVSASESVVYASWNGGETWDRASSPAGGAFPGGDPMLTIDRTGRAYFSTITPEIHLWRSTDQGRSWVGPTVIGEGLAADRQWVATGPVGQEGGATVHVAAKTAGDDGRDVILLSRSQDGGVTFAGRTLMPLDSGYLHTVTDLVVRDDGTILLPYLANYGRVAGPEEVYRGTRWLLVSRDGGAGWSGPYPVSDNLQYGNRSWDRAMKGLGGGDVAVDDGDGPYGGSVYMAWAAVLDDHLQIVVARSRDGGRSWSDPVRLNDAGFESDHSTPMVAVNADGIVAVTWNDRRHDPDDACFEHYVAISEDGARTFGPNRRVSERQTCPEAESRWLNGGDTQGLAAHGGGFRTVWSYGTESEGSLRPWTALISIH